MLSSNNGDFPYLIMPQGGSYFLIEKEVEVNSIFSFKTYILLELSKT